MKKFFAVFTLCLLTLANTAQADQGGVWSAAQSDDYGTKAGGMFGRGLVNFGTCFVDILVQTVEKTQDGPAFIGTMSGLGSGLGCTALRATSGATDVLTFWVPNFNGFPVSSSYSNCLEGTSFDSNMTPAAAAPAYDYSAEQSKLDQATRDAQDAIAAERAKALSDINAERARLEAEKKAAEANKMKFIK